MKKTLPALVLVLSTLFSFAVFGRPTEARIFTSPTLKVWYQDSDSDGYGNVDVKKRQSFKPIGYVADASDCKDSDSSTHPGAEEIWYNGVNNDCSGGSDYDQDEDGYKSNLYIEPTEYADYYVDCNDTNENIKPGGVEIDGNAIDEDCDGEAIIEIYSEPVWACWWSDNDWDGYGASGEEEDSPFTCSWRYENRRVWWMDSGDALWSFQVNDEGQDCDDSDSSVYPGTSAC